MQSFSVRSLAGTPREQIRSLDGDPRAALEARVILRTCFREIVLRPSGRSLWADTKSNPTPSNQAVGLEESNGGATRIALSPLPAIAQWFV